VGIVCPVYDFCPPSLVAEFVPRLGLSQTGYCFAVLTMGGMGVSALHQLDKLVFAHNSRHLDAAFVVRMVGNFVPLYDPAKEAKREKLLADAETRFTDIADSIEKGLIVRPDIAFLSAFLKRFSMTGLSDRSMMPTRSLLLTRNALPAEPVQKSAGEKYRYG